MKYTTGDPPDTWQTLALVDARTTSTIPAGDYAGLSRAPAPFVALSRPFTIDPQAMSGMRPRFVDRHGIFALDLRREAARSGVPAWWRPLESRRKRCVSWGAHRQRMRRFTTRFWDSRCCNDGPTLTSPVAHDA